MLAKMSFVLGTFLFSFLWPGISLCTGRSASPGPKEENPINFALSPDEDLVIAMPSLPTNLQPFSDSPGKKYLEEENYEKYTEELERIAAQNANDDEIAVYVYMTLGITWDALAGDALARHSKETQIEYDKKALGYFEKARDIAIKDKKKYRLHLAHIYHGLGEVHEDLGNYSLALEVYKTIAKEYREVGTGRNLNKLAVIGVSKVSALSRRLDISVNELRKYLLNTASENKGNEIGIVALAQLAHLEVSNKNYDAALKVLQLLKERYQGTPFVGSTSVSKTIEGIEKMIKKAQQHGHNK